jgi:hypothetical protein
MPKSNNRPQKDLKPVLHIYCEGEKTEPNYISGYLDKFFPTNRRLKVIKLESTKNNKPRELVNEAVKAQKNLPSCDSFWVVYDRESEQSYSDDKHATAYNKAQKHAISVALSNVCFETWLLLHFQGTTAPYSCYDDLRNNSALRAEFKKRGISDYDKGNKAIFSVFKENEIIDARTRARRINSQTIKSTAPSRTQPYQLNPYTNVYELLDAIDEIANK